MPQALSDERLKAVRKRVYALMARHGVDGISSGRLAAEAGIGKATLYRYFSGKEDMARGMADFMRSHLDALVFPSPETLSEALSGVEAFFRECCLLTALAGTRFLADLERRFPDALEACGRSGSEMRERFALFYDAGVGGGLFRGLSLPLLERSLHGDLSAVLDGEILARCGLTLSEALEETYRGFLCRLLAPSRARAADRGETYAFCPSLARELEEDFFVGEKDAGTEAYLG